MRKISFHWLALTLISFLSFITMVFSNSNDDYQLLILLPLIFLILLLLFFNTINKNIKNYGLLILLYLLLIKDSITPAVMSLGNYETHIESANSFIPLSILITAYELIIIFIVLWFLDNQSNKKLEITTINKIDNGARLITYNPKRITPLVVFLISAFIASFILVPECSEMYMSIFQVSSVAFTGNESSDIVSQYSVDFFSKFILVTHSYLSRIIRFLLPLHIIALIRNKGNTLLRYRLCVFISMVGILFVDGTVSRVLVYSFVLLLLTNNLFDKERNNIKYAFIIVFLVIGYFYVRSVVLPNSFSSGFGYLSNLLTAYFSGITNTAANLKMSDLISWEEKWLFFTYDFLQTIPYGNTLFGLQNLSYQKLFFTIAEAYGQIPTSIGTGYLYFGLLLSPIYSALFAAITFKAGLKARETRDSMTKGVYLLTMIYAAMGVVMYYVHIVFSIIFSLILPLLLICRFAQKKMV